MSLASIKQKEAKGKKNVLPKLRTLVANPYKQHSPVLPETDLLQFRQLLQEAMTRSGHTKKTFATHANIHIGLESSLRAINAGRFCCAFISLSLRPAHLIRLVATSATVKRPTAPVYAQPKLEELTDDIFGVRALILVLPLNVSDISQELAEWIAARRRPLREKQQIITRTAKKLKTQVVIDQKMKAPPAVSFPTPAKKEWSGDFISCSNEDVIKLDQVNEQLDEALNDLTMKAKSKASLDKTPNSILAVTTSVSQMDVQELKHKTNDDAVQIDDFLPIDKYRPLVVTQVRANPNKKPKKKRNKKQQITKETN